MKRYEFSTKKDAVAYLKSRGMNAVSESVFTGQNRVYFSKGENDVFFDHSATLDKTGGTYYVADFSV